MPTRWTITSEPVATPEVRQAVWEYFVEIGERILGRPATDAELHDALDDDTHADLAPPNGVFLIARGEDAKLLGCAGVRRIPDAPHTAELKRMYVRPAARGLGLGKALLHAAESAARSLGATRMVLDTRSELREARALYAAHGYEETAPYNDHGYAEHWFAKRLG